MLERDLGSYEHARAVAKLCCTLGRLQKGKPLFGCISVRLRLGVDRYRIPDISVFAGEEPQMPIPDFPPHVVIEVVTDDRFSEFMGKLSEYRDFGVPNIWLVLPALRMLCVADGKSVRLVQSLILPEYGVELTPADPF